VFLVRPPGSKLLRPPGAVPKTASPATPSRPPDRTVMARAEDLACLAPPSEVLQDFPLAGKMLIGRDPAAAQIHLEHPQISRVHAHITLENSHAVVVDLSSANGTYVNGARIRKPTVLRPGDQLDVGPYALAFDGKALLPRTRSDNVELVAREVRRVVTNRETGKPLTLLDDVTLVIRPREFVCLLGPSGSGKSTLLSALSGRTTPDKGRGEVNGTDLHAHFDVLKQDIAVVPQKDILHDSLSVGDALWYTARLRLPPDLNRAEVRKCIDDTLETVSLSQRRGTLIRHLSGGQVKRASLANEIMCKPSLLFLDEVTSGLDEQTDRDMMDLFRSVADTGKTVVCITHSLANVERTCHLVVILTPGGRLAFVGKPAEALEYFNIRRLGDVYERMAEQPAEHWQQAFKACPLYQRYVGSRLPRQEQAPPPPDGAQGRKLSEKGRLFLRQPVSKPPAPPRSKAPLNAPQQGIKAPSSVRRSAGARRSVSQAPIIAPRDVAGGNEGGRLSIGALIGGVLCFLLIVGSVGGIGALVYILNQKQAADSGDSNKLALRTPQATPHVTPVNDTPPFPPPPDKDAPPALADKDKTTNPPPPPPLDKDKTAPPPDNDLAPPPLDKDKPTPAPDKDKAFTPPGDKDKTSPPDTDKPAPTPDKDKPPSPDKDKPPSPDKDKPAPTPDKDKPRVADKDKPAPPDKDKPAPAPEKDPALLFSEDFKGVEKDALPKGWDGDSLSVQKDEDDRSCLEVDGHGMHYVTLPPQFIKGDFQMECEFRLSAFSPLQLRPNDHQLNLELASRSSTPLTVTVNHLAGVRIAGEYKAADGFTPLENIRLRLTRKGDSYKVGVKVGDDYQPVGSVNVPGKGCFEQIRIGLMGGKPPMNPQALTNQFAACLYWVKIASLESKVPTPDPNEPPPPAALYEDFSKVAAGALPKGWTKTKANNLAVRTTGGPPGLELINPVKGADGTTMRIDLKDDFYMDMTAVFRPGNFQIPQASPYVALFFKGPKTKDLVVQLFPNGGILVLVQDKPPQALVGTKFWTGAMPNLFRVERSSKDKTYQISLNYSLVGNVPVAVGPGPFTSVEVVIYLNEVNQASPRVTGVRCVPLVPEP
jgi:ABC-type multidrug transport system ATPase subunit